MKTRYLATLLLFLLLTPAMLLADTTYQPFVLASVSDNSLADETDATVAALQSAGFTVAGRYAPLADANVIVVTDPELKAIAAKTERGGYAAGQRIGVARRNGKTEVSFVNPLYLQYAYRLDGDMQGIHDRLSAALGNLRPFGAEKGLTADKLLKYHYMMGMQYFDDPSELGRFDSHAAAIAAVEHGLARAGDALTQIYRIDIPGKQQAVIGVGMKATGRNEQETDIDETHQLSIVDFEGHSKVAYFPYEVLVNGNEVEALHMRFRMAVHFPDLGMMGAHSFMKLKSSPGATEDFLEAMLSPDQR